MKDSHKRDGHAIKKKNVFAGLKILGCRVVIMFLLLLLFFSFFRLYIFRIVIILSNVHSIYIYTFTLCTLCLKSAAVSTTPLSMAVNRVLGRIAIYTLCVYSNFVVHAAQSSICRVAAVPSLYSLPRGG